MERNLIFQSLIRQCNSSPRSSLKPSGMETRTNKLWPVDSELFTAMKTDSITPEEFNFFQNMQFKQEHEPTLSNDLILSENDNPERIYIVREVYDEYVVGCANHPENEVHVMNLSEALNINLSWIGVKTPKGATIGEWLRSINYKGISYNHNYDNM